MAKKLFLVIGAPGSGKTTNASIIAKRHKEHLANYSIGDMLRDEVASGSKLGGKINEFIKKGELVPLDIIMNTMITAIKYTSANVVLIDGFPRSVEQMEMFDLLLSREESIELVSVIELKVCEQIAKERILCRAAEVSPGGRRPDDSEAVFSERMAIYEKPLQQIRDFYTKKKLLKVIDGEKPMDIVVGLMELIVLSRTDLPSVHTINDSYHLAMI